MMTIDDLLTPMGGDLLCSLHDLAKILAADYSYLISRLDVIGLEPQLDYYRSVNNIDGVVEKDILLTKNSLIVLLFDLRQINNNAENLFYQ